MSPTESHYQHIFGLTLPNAHHPGLRRLKREHIARLHGHKPWDASWLLMDYLHQHPPAAGAHLLEAGCGWGLAGIYCAKHFAARVLAVDIDAEVMPFLTLNAEPNGVHIETRVCDFDDVDSALLADFDTLIAADICFWDEMADSVFALIERACQADLERVVLTDPGRAPFLAMAERCVEAFYAELSPRHIQQPFPVRGYQLVIENR